MLGGFHGRILSVSFLQPARREVLERYFESARLTEVLRRLRTQRLIVVETRHPTPLAFPLVGERLGGLIMEQTEKDRVFVIGENSLHEVSRNG